MQTIFNELSLLWSSIDRNALDDCINRISKHSGNIICLGAGRMGYSIQAFSMRLSHLGFDAFMIGDTTLPRIKVGDLVIVNSSSGNTPSIVLLTEIAKKHGAHVICLTSDRLSAIATAADLVVSYDEISSSQLMKSAYEQFTLLLFDYIAQQIFTLSKMDIDRVENNHSVLE